MSATDELLERARRYAASFHSSRPPSPPARKTAIVACMDARLNPHALFDLAEGDAHVIRNAGGVVTDDTIRSLAISQLMLGTEEIILIQHTDCGLLAVTDEQFAERLEELAGHRPEWNARAFDDLDVAVGRSIATIKASPFVPNKAVRGFVYDVATGMLREVIAH